MSKPGAHSDTGQPDRGASAAETAGGCAQALEHLGPFDFAARPLFGPIADLLARFSVLPDCDALNALMARDDRAGGVRFVVPDNATRGYEMRIHTRAEIVTRPDNWHDFFNALVWLRFPETKAALNQAHLRFLGRGTPETGRGPVRDALTQFDESGIIVASTDASLLELLSHRCWKALFWMRRDEVVRNMRFLVFGHGLYDALRAPFYRICGRAALLPIDRATIERPLVDLCATLDALVAARFAADYYPRPRALLALPLLGIPGVTPENAGPTYYDDQAQFRPLPQWA